MDGRGALGKTLDKYGECDIAVDDIELLHTFVKAMVDKEPYSLTCFDVQISKADHVKVVEAIWDIEKQYGVAPEG